MDRRQIISTKKIVRSTIIVCALYVCITGMQGCYYDKEELLYPGSTGAVDCATVPAKFAADIQPLISSKCAISGCHDNTASGGVIFQNYAQVKDKADRIQTRVVIEKSMPPTGALPPAEVNKIKCWLDGGALNN